MTDKQIERRKRYRKTDKREREKGNDRQTSTERERVISKHRSTRKKKES